MSLIRSVRTMSAALILISAGMTDCLAADIDNVPFTASRSAEQTVTLAQTGQDNPRKEEIEFPPKNLVVWKKELEAKRKELEMIFQELLNKKSQIEIRQNGVKKGDDTAAIEKEILELNARIDAYDAQRAAFEKEATAYNEVARRKRPEVIRERVVYRGPDRTMETEQPKNESKKVSEEARKEEKPATPDALERRRNALDAEYAELVKEKEALLERQKGADTDDKMRAANAEVDKFNEKLRDYDKRRRQLNETIAEYNETVQREQSTETAPKP